MDDYLSNETNIDLIEKSIEKVVLNNTPSLTKLTAPENGEGRGVALVSYVRGPVMVTMSLDASHETNFVLTSVTVNEDVVAVLDDTGEFIIKTPNKDFVVDPVVSDDVFRGLRAAFEESLANIS